MPPKLPDKKTWTTFRRWHPEWPATPKPFYSPEVAGIYRPAKPKKPRRPR